jgi:hypothetical protein
MVLADPSGSFAISTLLIHESMLTDPDVRIDPVDFD